METIRNIPGVQVADTREEAYAQGFSVWVANYNALLLHGFEYRVERADVLGICRDVPGDQHNPSLPNGCDIINNGVILCVPGGAIRASWPFSTPTPQKPNNELTKADAHYIKIEAEPGERGEIIGGFRHDQNYSMDNDSFRNEYGQGENHTNTILNHQAVRHQATEGRVELTRQLFEGWANVVQIYAGNVDLIITDCEMQGARQYIGLGDGSREGEAVDYSFVVRGLVCRGARMTYQRASGVWWYRDFYVTSRARADIQDMIVMPRIKVLPEHQVHPSLVLGGSGPTKGTWHFKNCTLLGHGEFLRVTDSYVELTDCTVSADTPIRAVRSTGGVCRVFGGAVIGNSLEAVIIDPANPTALACGVVP